MWELLSSYSLIDFIPLETSVYLRLFERANQRYWPLPIVTTLVAVVTILLALNHRYKFCYLLLATAWCLSGFIFHLQLLQELNWIGGYLGGAFLLQGLLIGACGWLTSKSPNQSAVNGMIIMLTALPVYGLLPLLTKTSWSAVEIFAIAPDPTCWFTLGVLLFTGHHRWWLLIIPCLWATFSSALAYILGLWGGLLLATLTIAVSGLLITARFIQRKPSTTSNI